MIGVPIKDGENVVGTLTVDRVNSGGSHVRFDHDVRFLTMVANLVGQTCGCTSWSRMIAKG